MKQPWQHLQTLMFDIFSWNVASSSSWLSYSWIKFDLEYAAAWCHWSAALNFLRASLNVAVLMCVYLTLQFWCLSGSMSLRSLRQNGVQRHGRFLLSLLFVLGLKQVKHFSNSDQIIYMIIWACVCVYRPQISQRWCSWSGWALLQEQTDSDLSSSQSPPYTSPAGSKRQWESVCVCVCHVHSIIRRNVVG